MLRATHETIPLAVQLEDGSFVVHYFITHGRGTFLPKGAVWTGSYQWKREPNEANITDNLNSSFADRPYVSWRKLSKGDIPEDRSYRNAWVDDGKAITHDIVKARELHRDILRHERAGKFPALDAQYARAFGQGLTKEAARVEATRQALRDAPADPRIDAAQTVEELKAIQLPG